MQMGNKHIGTDKDVTWEEIIEARNMVAGHLRAFTKVFNPGENLREKAKRMCGKSNYFI